MEGEMEGGRGDGGEPLLTLPAECGKKSPRQASSTCRILKPSSGGEEEGGALHTHARSACTDIACTRKTLIDR